MNKSRLAAVSLIGIVGTLAGGAFLPQKSAHAQIVGGPLPPVPTPPNIVPLEPVEKLGKDMLYDDTMSYPSGYACANATPRLRASLGAQLDRQLRGAARSRASYPAGSTIAGPRATAMRRSAPEGPYYDTLNAIWIGGNFWDGRAYDTAIQAQGPPINPNEMDNTPVGTAPNQYPPALVRSFSPGPILP